MIPPSGMEGSGEMEGFSGGVEATFSNPKSEAPNPKQFQNSNIRKLGQLGLACWFLISARHARIS
jgi:hypothetical protein